MSFDYDHMVTNAAKACQFLHDVSSELYRLISANPDPDTLTRSDRRAIAGLTAVLLAAREAMPNMDFLDEEDEDTVDPPADDVDFGSAFPMWSDTSIRH
jgi:hypothetical protein